MVEGILSLKDVRRFILVITKHVMSFFPYIQTVLSVIKLDPLCRLQNFLIGFLVKVMITELIQTDFVIFRQMTIMKLTVNRRPLHIYLPYEK